MILGLSPLVWGLIAAFVALDVVVALYTGRVCAAVAARSGGYGGRSIDAMAYMALGRVGDDMARIVNGVFVDDEGRCGYCHGDGCHVCEMTARLIADPAGFQPMAAIAPGSRRTTLWREIMGNTDPVPIISPYTRRNTAPGYPEGALFYHLDLRRITPEQRKRLVRVMAREFGQSQADVALDFEDPEHGVPILAEDVTIHVTPRTETYWYE